MVALAGSDAGPASDKRARRTAGLAYNYLLTNVAVLRRAGFVKMRRAAGGLQPAKPAHTITLSEIICAIDGPLTLADGSQPTNPADQGLEQPAAVTVRG
jgi:DNA-binding IscR family transcriptional regulator